jgi:hypothetical protein
MLSLARKYRPPLRERLQEWLMVSMMEEPRFRDRVLRFVDVLAALDHDRKGTHVKRLFQEYMGGHFPNLPLMLRLALSIARSRFIPARLEAFAARQVVSGFAQRFIVLGGTDSVFSALGYLNLQSRFGSFDILGEKVMSQEEAVEYKERYLGLIDGLSAHPGAGERTGGDMPQI